MKAEVEVMDFKEEILVQERCIKQHALIAVKNAKFHSNLQKASQFIAEIALQVREEISFTSKSKYLLFYF